MSAIDSPMPDGVGTDPSPADPDEPSLTPAEAGLLRKVRFNLSLWSGGITLAVLVVLGIVLYVAVARSLSVTGTAQVEARAGCLPAEARDGRVKVLEFRKHAPRDARKSEP